MHETATVRREAAVVESQLDDTRVVLNTDLRYLGLDAVGQRVWDLLDRPRQVGALVDDLTEEYDVDRGTCLRDVAAFLERLAELRLVIVE